MNHDDEKPPVKLIGEDGNAYNIIGLCGRAARKARWSDEKWQAVQKEMMASDYDNLLATALKYFEVE